MSEAGRPRNRGRIFAACLIGLAAFLVLGVAWGLLVGGGGGGGDMAVHGLFGRTPVQEGPRGQPKEAWRTRGENLRVLEAADGLYAAEDPTSDRGDATLRRLDPRDGKTLWQARLRGIVGTLAVVDGVLVVSASDQSGDTQGLDPESGEQRWRAPGSVESGGQSVVVLNDGRGASVIDARTGASKVRTSGDPVTAVAFDDLRSLLLAGTERSLRAYDIGNGSVRWDVPARVQSVVATSDGALIVDGAVDDNRADLRLLRPSDGKEEWRQSVATFAGMTAAGDGLAIVGDDRRVDLIDLDKGSAASSLATRSGRGLLTYLGSRTIFVSTSFEDHGSGEIAAVDLGKPSSLLWSERVSGVGCISVTSAGTVVGIVDREDLRVTLLSHKQGQRMWELSARTDSGQVSCAVADGAVAIVDGRDLVAYR